MSLLWKIPPPFLSQSAEKLHPWLYQQWKMSRDLWSHVLEPGCGLYFDTNDDLAVKVDGSTITCSSAGIAATGSVYKSIFDAKGDIIIGAGSDTYTRLAVGTDEQVLTGDSSTAYGLTWREPRIQYTFCFASNSAIAVGSTSVGLIDRISSTSLITCPAGKTMYVLAVIGSVRSGSTAGTYNLALLLVNKTSGVTTELATGSGTASVTVSMSQEWTFASPGIAVRENEEFYLGFKNQSDSAAALAAGPHQMFVVMFSV